MDLQSGTILSISIANLVLVIRLSYQAGRFTERVEAYEKRLDNLEEAVFPRWRKSEASGRNE